MTKSIVPARLNENNDKLILLDQTLLPEEEKYLELDTKEGVWDAIKRLSVRGAPAIGIAAAYGLYVCLNKIETDSVAELEKKLEEISDYLATSRPTAVNLFWALKRMKKRFELEKNRGRNVQEIKAALLEESNEILAEDQKMDIAIGENALTLLEPGMGLLTHCNAGGLATSGYGTAEAPMYL
ncbi:MAG: S-methyl-5-thioribose-1-phosphate isomerase, partial [Halanaerobium sp.]